LVIEVARLWVSGTLLASASCGLVQLNVLKVLDIQTALFAMAA
jgi:hypothetical protein